MKFSDIGRTEVLISWLQGFTQRDLSSQPPKDREKLTANIGIGESNLDRFIRVWVNRYFRSVDQKPYISRGKLPGTTTFLELKKLSGISS